MAKEEPLNEIKTLGESLFEGDTINPREHFFTVINSEAFREQQHKLFAVDDEETEDSVDFDSYREEIVSTIIRFLVLKVKQLKMDYCLEKVLIEPGKAPYFLPPSIYLVSDSDKHLLSFAKEDSKELYYAYESVCGDFNVFFAKSTDVVDRIYSDITDGIRRLSWKDICKITGDFTVDLIGA